MTARLRNRRNARRHDRTLPRLHRRRESMRQMLAPLDAVTTSHELLVDPEELFLSVEDLDGARAESARRAAVKKRLEADMWIAGKALEV